MTQRTSRWLLLAALTACQDAGGPTPAAPIVPQLAIVAGDVQTDTVMRTLPVQLAARLTDQATGDPLGGRILNWSVLAGDGTVFAAVTQTGADGVARQSWTLGPRAGAQRLVARYLDPETGEPVTLDTATATAVPGVAGRVWAHSSATSNALPVGDSVWIWLTYTDAYDNPEPPCADGGRRDRAALVAWIPEDTTEAVTRGSLVRAGAVGTWVVSVGPTDDFHGDLVSVTARVATVRDSSGGCLADRWPSDHVDLVGWSFNTR